jgi:hypothetical protein
MAVDEVCMRTMNAVWGGPIQGKPACQGWKCSECPWTFDMLAMYRPSDLPKWERKAEKDFDKHDCANLNAIAAQVAAAKAKAAKPLTTEQRDKLQEAIKIRRDGNG